MRHPGEDLKLLLREKEYSQRYLADLMGLEVKAVNRVCNGKCAITPMFAYKLGKVFESYKAEHWLRLQNSYDLDRLG
jgi:addiction module HigA family antidote